MPERKTDYEKFGDLISGAFMGTDKGTEVAAQPRKDIHPPKPKPKKKKKKKSIWSKMLASEFEKVRKGEVK